MDTPIYRYELDGTLIKETEENFIDHFEGQNIFIKPGVHITHPSMRFWYSQELAKQDYVTRLNNQMRLNILRIRQLERENLNIKRALAEMEAV